MPLVDAKDAVGASLVVRLNGVIRSHYPEGQVNYNEVITVLRSLAGSYETGLRALMEIADSRSAASKDGQ